MKKRFRSLVPMLLAMSLVVQQGSSLIVRGEETQSETVTEQQTQAVTEPETQTKVEPPTELQTQQTAAATEPETQVPTEPATEKPTEAPTEAETTPPTEPETQAPTEPATEKPTEAQTQEPTESQTQEPTEKQTEAQTQEPTEKQTEAQTQEPTEEQTETQTQEPTEKQTETEKETESETEEPVHVNDGAKVTSSGLQSDLAAVLPYLIAANHVSGMELPEEDVLTGQDSASALEKLKKTARKLANGTDSSSVKVVNLYADEDGKLDTEPLEEAFDGKKIDVAGQYVLVNVVAFSDTQKLDFSGYSLVDGSKNITYEDVTEKGVVLYNFTAFEEGEFIDYKGTLTLSSASGLKGTWLAPAAEVKLQSDLSGAVYADSVELTGELELEKIVLIEGREEETETEESETAESETESSSESVSKRPVRKSARKSVSQKTSPSDETETGEPNTNEPDTNGSDTNEPGSAPEWDQLSEGEQNSLGGIAMMSLDEEAPPIAKISGETEKGTETETGKETETGTETETGDETSKSVKFDSPVVLKLELVNVAGEAPVLLSGGTLEVKAADAIIDESGEEKFAKDAVVVTAPITAAGENAFELEYSGNYVLTVKDLPKTEDAPNGYMASLAAGIPFKVDADGQVVFGETGGQSVSPVWWDSAAKMFRYPVFPSGTPGSAPVAAPGVLQIELQDGEGAPLTKPGAEFVLRDNSGKAVRTLVFPEDTDGTLLVTGIAAGSYKLEQIKAADGYQIQVGETEVIADASGVTVVFQNAAVPAASNTLSVTLETWYDSTQLTAEADSTTYVALFDFQGVVRQSAVQAITQKAGTVASEAVKFAGIAAGSPVKVVETDEYGKPVSTGQYNNLLYQNGAQVQSVSYAADKTSDEAVTLRRMYSVLGGYPDGLFSYMASVQITKNIYEPYKQSGQIHAKAKAVTDTFYVRLYEDAARLVPIGDPIPLSMHNASSASALYEMKMTVRTKDYYLSETDAQGTILETGNENYRYSVTYSGATTGGTDTTGRFSMVCGEQSSVTVTNTLSWGTVRIKVTDAAGGLLPGAELLFKNSDGRVLRVGNVVTFESESSEIVRTNGTLPNGTYYLSEVKAPSGYLPAPDVVFTVEAGKTVDVTMVNHIAAGGTSLTVGLQVYVGDDQLYAQDTTDGTHARAGRYTRYVALFADEARTQKVSDVQEITIEGFTGSTTFHHLESGRTYYLSETDQYGQVRSSNDTRTISYTDHGALTAHSNSDQMIVSENYGSLPQGFRYTARLTLSKQVTDASGAPKAVSESFYIGIYRNADYSDAPTLVRLDLNNASSASVSRRILLSGENDVTYYFAEVDANGNRITDSSSFGYTPSIDRSHVTLTRSADESVTVTNRTKVSRVTLYLTKRVYEGTELYPTSNTFYAGLFKDPQFTELYANPIPLTLQNSSSVTLRLSLNLGSASAATIYIAEVDRNGRVVQSGSGFGYDVRMINSTAAFDQQTTEIQTILLNSVAGTTTDSDWNNIYSSEENNVGGFGGGSSSGYGYSDYVSDNGVASGGTASSVQTADTTPWASYLLLMLASGVAVILAGSRRRRGTSEK